MCLPETDTYIIRYHIDSYTRRLKTGGIVGISELSLFSKNMLFGYYLFLSIYLFIYLYRWGIYRDLYALDNEINYIIPMYAIEK